jgi:hypothetical protein
MSGREERRRGGCVERRLVRTSEWASAAAFYFYCKVARGPMVAPIPVNAVKIETVIFWLAAPLLIEKGSETSTPGGPAANRTCTQSAGRANGDARAKSRDGCPVN